MHSIARQKPQPALGASQLMMLVVSLGPCSTDWGPTTNQNFSNQLRLWMWSQKYIILFNVVYGCKYRPKFVVFCRVVVVNWVVICWIWNRLRNFGTGSGYPGNRVRVPGSDYKSLVTSKLSAVTHTNFGSIQKRPIDTQVVNKNHSSHILSRLNSYRQACKNVEIQLQKQSSKCTATLYKCSTSYVACTRNAKIASSRLGN